ncbi:MAG: hypothetical protein ACI89L_001677 [Phycisphaerales bacterium]|jgi:hypothetical protein
MRVFWSLMLVLFVASMGVFVVPERAAPRASPSEANEALSPRTEQAEPEPKAEPKAEPEPEPAAVVSEPEPEPVIAPAPDPFAAAAEAYLRSTKTGAAPATPEPAPVPVTEATDKPAITQAPSFAVNADGSFTVHGVTVPGDGTLGNPFVLDWPLLTGVARVYKPEKGMNAVPAWLGDLEGKRVRLTGHIVLPLMATSTDELLLTMNPWDGCCVGVPPTPYDAMEVTLGEPVSMQGASMYGSLEGTFRTDPYIVSGWLLGLYLLDDARVVK